MYKLNLGCGKFYKTGYINVDKISDNRSDITHDLNDIPYPFEDNQFVLIEADHLLEHLEDVMLVMRELYRITIDRGIIKIKVPHFSRGFTHVQHRCSFDVTFPLYFNPSFKGGYQGIPLELIDMRLRWFAQPYLKKLVLTRFKYYSALILGKLIDLFANISPYTCSRLWVFWVGGFEEIEFQFKVKK